MIYRFLIISDESDDFKRDIRIDSETTFLELHDAIIESVGYKTGEMSSFFICDEDWNKETEITLVEMDTSSEYDNYTMADTKLEDLVEEEHQKLLFVFDYMTERAFFMELGEIIPGKNLKKPECVLAVGAVPAQFIDFEDTDIIPSASTIDEDFYGDSEYDPDELGEDGFNSFGGEAPSSDPFSDF